MASVCSILKQRELGISRHQDQRSLRLLDQGASGFSRDPVLQTCQVLRQLIFTNQRTFEAASKDSLVQQGPFIYNEGRIWSKNVRKKEFEVFDLHRNPKPNPNRRIVLHSIEAHPRWVDQDFWSCPTYHKVDKTSTSHLSSLFVLRQSPKHCLQRFDVWSGRLLQTITLPDNLKYVEMNCDHESSNIVLKSKRWPYQGAHPKTTQVAVNFLIFQFPPLNFKYHLEIDVQVFGPGQVKDADVSHGFLFVMFEGHVVEVFSMERILSEFLIERANLSDIGEANIRITRKPDALLSVKTLNHYLQLSSCLPHSFLAVKSGEIQTFDLASGVRVPNGVISKKDYFEENEIFFHPGKAAASTVSFEANDSPRIIHIQGSKFRILSLEAEGVKEAFCIDANKECLSEIEEVSAFNRRERRAARNPSSPERLGLLEPEEGAPPLRSSSGRLIQRPANFRELLLSVAADNSSDSDFGDSYSVSFGFEYDLDIFVLLFYKDLIKDEDDDDQSPITTWLEKLLIVDNRSLQIMKEVFLGIELSKRQGVRNSLVMLDKDILVVRENNSTLLSISTFLLRESNVDVDVIDSLKRSQRKGQRRSVSS